MSDEFDEIVRRYRRPLLRHVRLTVFEAIAVACMVAIVVALVVG